jgi:hypothetical protein
LFPVVGATLLKRENQRLVFEGFEISGDFNKVIEGRDFTAVDQTLVTNWTHGGVYKGKMIITTTKESSNTTKK